MLQYLVRTILVAILLLQEEFIVKTPLIWVIHPNALYSRLITENLRIEGVETASYCGTQMTVNVALKKLADRPGAVIVTGLFWDQLYDIPHGLVLIQRLPTRLPTIVTLPYTFRYDSEKTSKYDFLAKQLGTQTYNEGGAVDDLCYLACHLYVAASPGSNPAIPD